LRNQLHSRLKAGNGKLFPTKLASKLFALSLASLFLWGAATICQGGIESSNILSENHAYFILPEQTLKEREVLVHALHTPFRFQKKEEGVITCIHTTLPYKLHILDQQTTIISFPKQAMGFLPPFEKKALISKKRFLAEKFRKRLESFQIAGSSLKKECGVIYMKMNHDYTLPKLILIDGLGLKQTFSLTTAQFALQHLAEPTKNELNNIKYFLKKTLDKGVDDHILNPYLELGEGPFGLQYRYLHSFTPLFSKEKIAYKRELVEKTLTHFPS
jgi:hypothetical protein